MTVVIYPGTFDPLTNGHMDIAERAAHLFDEVIVAVAKSAGKSPQFSFEDRLAMCEETFSVFNKVSVDSFDGLLVDYAKSKSAKIILRGLRGATDLDFEFQLSGMNKTLSPTCETLFIKASDTTSSISSSIVREIAAMGGDVSLFVPPAVAMRLK